MHFFEAINRQYVELSKRTVGKCNRNLEAKEISSSGEIPQEGRSLRLRGIQNPP